MSPKGQVLHRAELPAPAMLGAAAGTGISEVLDWLDARNIRVDLVAHHIAHHAERDHVLRLAPDRVSTLAEFEACKATVYDIDAVAAAGLHAPAGCPKKLKVRCDTSCAN